MYDGTWASGPWPMELVDFETMREMHWSWADLQDTPAYVRRYCADFIQLRNKAEADANERANREIEESSAR